MTTKPTPGYLSRTIDTRTHRVHLVTSIGRSVGSLRYVNGKAEWPTGPLTLGDRFTETEALHLEGQWSDYFATKGTGYRALAWPIDKEQEP